jgi:hypothetical protein
MRKSSRLMKKYQPASEPIRLADWLFLLPLGGLFLLVIWLILFAIWKEPWSLLFIPIIISVFYILDSVRHKKLSDMLKDRKNDSICSFARNFDCRKIDTWVIRAVYEQLQDYMQGDHPNFPIRANDNIYDELLIDEEDFELDLVDEIAQRTGRLFNDSEKNPYYGNVNTVADLVYFFNLQPMKNAI